MFIPAGIVVLFILAAGFPGFVAGVIVGHWRQRNPLGFVIGWLGGVFGALVIGFLCIQLEQVLPQHVENDVFGPVRVIDFPPDSVWLKLKFVSIIFGSLGSGWLAVHVLIRGSTVQLHKAK